MSAPLAASPSSLGSTPLTSFSSSSRDTQSSQSSQSTPRVSRYAPRRSMAVIITESDSEEDIDPKVAPRHEQQDSSIRSDIRRYMTQPISQTNNLPRRLPSQVHAPSGRSAATTRTVAHQARITSRTPQLPTPIPARSAPPVLGAGSRQRNTSRQTPLPTASRISFPRLGRFNSLPHEKLSIPPVMEETSESLPTKLSGRKREREDEGVDGVDHDKGDGEATDGSGEEKGEEGFEADDEEGERSPDAAVEDTGGALETCFSLSSPTASQADTALPRSPSPNVTFSVALSSSIDGMYGTDALSDDRMDIDPTSGLHPPVPNDEYDFGLSSLARPAAVSLDAADTKSDDEEGDFLAKLLMRAQRMREGKDPDVLSDTRAPIEAGEGGEEENVLTDLDDELLQSDFGDDFDAALQLDEGGEVNSRRHQALAFLESLPLRLLSQLNTSLMILNEQERSRLSPKRAVKKGGWRKNDSQAEEGEEGMGEGMELIPDETQGEDGVEGEGKKGSGRGGGDELAHVGIELSLTNRKTGADQVVSFPDDPLNMGNKATSQHRLAEIMRVAALMYAAILTDTVTTKRDIFYKDVALFGTQATVDKLVDDIAASAGLKRQDFMVCATSKGLIASSALKVFLKTGEELSFSATNASLIPPIERIEHISSDTEHIDWVLIVEKDAVFQTLCGYALLGDPEMGSGVLITGKGYPDLATLQLASLIATAFPSARFYALVDADPHGLDILSVYTHGSQATKFSHDHADLGLGDRLEWMGVKASEWAGLGVRYDDLLPLSEKDVQKARFDQLSESYLSAMAMLSNRVDMPSTWRRELVHMLHLNKKAEIQVLAMRGQHDHHDAETEGMVDGEDGEEQAEGETGWTGSGMNGVVRYVVEKLKM